MKLVPLCALCAIPIVVGPQELPCAAQSARAAQTPRSESVSVAIDTITDFAGSPAGRPGDAGNGGPATSAGLNSPYGVAVDSSGNLYLSDVYVGDVRQVNTAGIIVGVVGWKPITAPACTFTPGPFCGDGGPAIDAGLTVPSGLAVDADDNLYIADTGDSAIRKVDAKTGIITTIAGISQCSAGSCLPDPGYAGDGGLATQAQLNKPSSIAFDGQDNLYFVDSGNSVIRVINAATGDISTLSLSISGLVPGSVSFDSKGNLLVVDIGNDQVWQYNPGTTATALLAGVGGNPGAPYCAGETDTNGDGCAATQAALNAPAAVLADPDGNLYISDEIYIREVDASTGLISVFAGNGSSQLGNGGPAIDAGLYFPVQLAFDPSGNLYFADFFSYEIREINLTGVGPSTVATPKISPAGPSLKSGATVTISDATPKSIIYYTTDGTTPTTSSLVYSGPISVDKDTVITAFAIADGYNPSLEVSTTYTVAQATVTTLTSSANPAKFGAAVTFTAMVKPESGTGTPTGTVAFSVDGKAVSSTSLAGSGKAVFTTAALTVGSHLVVATYSGDQDFAGSDASLTEKITVKGTVAKPVIMPAAGTYAPGLQVKITDATAGASVYYTTNGKTPTTSSTRYTKTIVVNASETITAIAVETGWAESSAAQEAYKIEPATATPTFSPGPATYKTSQEVKIADATKGAVIHYTTNGTAPTTSSSIYKAPIKVAANETIRAIAVAPGHSVSAMGKAAYVIK